MVIGFEGAAIGSVPQDGWTDVWYTTSDDPAVVQTRVRGFMDRRVAICSSAVRGVRFRISAIPSNILAFQQRYRPGPGPFALPDTPWNALWTTVAVASQGVRRQWLIRGMTDDFIVNGAWAPNVPAWQTNFTELVRYMKNEGAFALQLINNTNPLRTVQGVQTDGTVTLPTGHAIVTGDIVRFFRTKFDDANMGGVHGDWLVIGTTGANQIQLNNWPVAGTVSVGKLRKIQLTYPVVSDIQVAGVRSRRVGRPLEVLRGRSRRKAS